MTKIQRAVCVILSILFLAVLCVMPNPRGIRDNLYRQLPFYCFLENVYHRYSTQEDKWTSNLMIVGNAKYLSEQVMSEAVKIEESPDIEMKPQTEVKEQAKIAEQVAMNTQAETAVQAKIAEKIEVKSQAEVTEQIDVKPKVEISNQADMQILPRPVIDLSMEQLADMDYLLGNFFIVDSATNANAVNLNAEEFLGKDLSIEKKKDMPQILIYHSHSQESFIDSREGMIEDTIVGVGAYLAEILQETYGYKVIHVTEAFDMAEGTLNRSSSYDYARTYVEQVLEKNPSVEVVIDLHRDGVAENRHLVTNINGKDTAQIMFYNGLSYTNSYGKVDYLPNPYIQDNLAFSFQLEYQAALYYPELYRGIYLAGLRYNLHLKPRALLLEAGAQTNTVQEVKNAMEPFADILVRVLGGY